MNASQKPTIPPFQAATVESVAKIIGDLYSGSELTRILHETRLTKFDAGEGNTKWRRLAQAVADNQGATRTGNALVGLITKAMSPQRTLDRAAAAAEARDELTKVLSFYGYKVTDEGKVANAKSTARTTDEALARGERLRTSLVTRGCHDEVLMHCRAGLAKSEYYEVVFEATKGLNDRLSTLSGIAGDGAQLVDATLCGASPVVRLNALASSTDRNEQTGIANLAKGVLSAFRNPVAHETRLNWMMSEQDALDALGTLSLIHRRLDHASTTIQP